MKKILNSVIFVAFLTACTDYIQQIDDRYGEWESTYIPGSSSDSTQSGVEGILKDARDGKTYKTVTIAGLTWMAENLNFEVENSYCYNDNASFCTKYGRLYTWSAAMDSAGKWSKNGKGCGAEKTCEPTFPVQGVCPAGWHLPRRAEWSYLLGSIGGGSTAAKILNSVNGWNDNGNGIDAYGFSAYPAGFRNEAGIYNSEGSYAIFWGSTQSDERLSAVLNISNSAGYLGSRNKNEGFSIRCIKDDQNSSIVLPQEDTIIVYGAELWNASSHENRIYTTSGNISHWEVFNDQDNAGTSDIYWKETSNGGNVLDLVIGLNGALQGSVLLGAGYEYPYAGLLFHLDGQSGENAYDITEWDGFCLTYKSILNFSIELVVENEATVTEYNNYKAAVPKTIAVVTTDFSWEKFKQDPGWGVTVDRSEILKKIRSIKLKFEGTAGTSGDFAFYEFGKLGTCVAK